MRSKDFKKKQILEIASIRKNDFESLLDELSNGQLEFLRYSFACLDYCDRFDNAHSSLITDSGFGKREGTNPYFRAYVKKFYCHNTFYDFIEKVSESKNSLRNALNEAKSLGKTRAILFFETTGQEQEINIE